MFELTENVAIVTGAGSHRGIGRATALALASQGARLVVVDIIQSGIDDTVAEIKSQGHDAIGIKADITSVSEIEYVVEQTLVRYGRIDILVNNAAINKDEKIIDTSIESWDRVIDVNLKGTFLFARAVLPTMIKQNYGRIINLSSVAGKTGCLAFGGVHYTSTKAGILGLTKQLVREVSEYNITANAIVPAMIATDIRGGLEDEKEQQKISQSIPLKRFGTPTEVAVAICFLASKEASYITGEDIDVNGGVYMD